MEEFESASKVNEMIKKNDKYRFLKQKEKEMLEDEDTFRLLIDYQNKQQEYNDALKYKDYGSNPDIKQKELADLKYKVDTNEFVKNYNLAYKGMKDFLQEITNIILKGVIK